MMKSPQGGNLGDPRGIEMESEIMISEIPYRSSLDDEERGLKRVLGRWKWLPSVVYLQNNVRTPKQDK
jgi:hypothetical protein